MKVFFFFQCSLSLVTRFEASRFVLVIEYLPVTKSGRIGWVGHVERTGEK